MAQAVAGGGRVACCCTRSCERARASHANSCRCPPPAQPVLNPSLAPAAGRRHVPSAVCLGGGRRHCAACHAVCDCQHPEGGRRGELALPRGSHLCIWVHPGGAGAPAGCFCWLRCHFDGMHAVWLCSHTAVARCCLVKQHVLACCTWPGVTSLPPPLAATLTGCGDAGAAGAERAGLPADGAEAGPQRARQGYHRLDNWCAAVLFCCCLQLLLLRLLLLVGSR